MLVAKHCFDLVSYTLDLVAFSLRKVHLIRYKLVLDVVSICLIVAVQGILFPGNYEEAKVEALTGPS